VLRSLLTIPPLAADRCCHIVDEIAVKSRVLTTKHRPGRIAGSARSISSDLIVKIRQFSCAVIVTAVVCAPHG